MHQPGRDESRAALQKIEKLLRAARDDIEAKDEKTDEARQNIEDAYQTCNDIGRNMGGPLKLLIDNARKSVKLDLASVKTVIIDIKVALGEVEHTKPNM
jgi:hypothetical protein